MHPIKDQDYGRMVAPAGCRLEHIVVEFLPFYAGCRDALLMPCRTITGLEKSKRHLPDRITARMDWPNTPQEKTRPLNHATDSSVEMAQEI